MNKSIRNQIEKKKWVKRLKVLGLKQTETQKFTCYKAQSKPCSCIMCSPYKYSRKIKHPLSYALISEEQREDFGLINLMKQANRTQKVSREKVMLKLGGK